VVPGIAASLLPVLQWIAGKLYAYPGIFDGFDSPPVIFFLSSMFMFIYPFYLDGARTFKGCVTSRPRLLLKQSHNIPYSCPGIKYFIFFFFLDLCLAPCRAHPPGHACELAALRACALSSIRGPCPGLLVSFDKSLSVRSSRHRLHAPRH
jgi:hypothetical protein